MRVHRVHDFGRGVGTGDGEYLRMRALHDVALRAETAGDDHAPVFLQRLADRIERLGDGGVDEPARVDHHQIGALIVGRNDVTFRAQLRHDPLRIDERFRAAETDHADAGRADIGCGEFGRRLHFTYYSTLR